MKIKPIQAFLLICLLFSCSVPKDVAYLQGLESLTSEQLAQMNQTYTSKICSDDLLTITVTAWDPSVVTPFNPPAFASGPQGETTLQTAQQLQTYLVDKEGYIYFPVLGKVKAEGLSKQELSENMQQQISKYVKDPMVNIQIVNFKVSVIGEVVLPCTIEVKNDRISIWEALGQAGDLTINGNRKNIKILRDNNGKKEFGFLDITDPAVFTSPYYYLQQNDVVYVEPNDAKKKNSKFSQAEQFNVTVLSSILSGLSLITSIVITIVANNNSNNN